MACSLVRLITGLGVETCVAMTGEVSLTGAIDAVSGLEGKLRFAHESERIEVVVLPRDNLREAEALVEQHGLTKIPLMPVTSMEEVIRRLFLQSVDDMQGTAGLILSRGVQAAEPIPACWHPQPHLISIDSLTHPSTHSPTRLHAARARDSFE